MIKILTKLSPPSFCGHAGDMSTLSGDIIHAEVNQGTNKKKKKKSILVEGTIHTIYVRVTVTRKGVAGAEVTKNNFRFQIKL